jgi:predicted metal-dependent HD superfamily phosphohydrolase
MRLPTGDLLARYAEPHRRYHTLEHIRTCLDHLAEARGIVEGERRVLEAAIWFHDAIYDPNSSDNEVESAELARRVLTEAGEPEPVCAEVERLVRLTASHTVEPGDRLGAVMVSIDLAILGAEPEAYDAYVRQVREEYGQVPELLWRLGRAGVLRRLLATPVLYADPVFHRRYEERARANLQRELATLED